MALNLSRAICVRQLPQILSVRAQIAGYRVRDMRVVAELVALRITARKNQVGRAERDPFSTAALANWNNFPIVGNSEVR